MLQPENSWAGCTALLGRLCVLCVCFSSPLPLQATFDTNTGPPLPVHNLLFFNLPIDICWFCSICHFRITLDWCWPWVSSGDETSHKWHYHVHLGWVRVSGGLPPTGSLLCSRPLGSGRREVQVPTAQQRKAPDPLFLWSNGAG